MSQNNTNTGLTTRRLENLTDGIFAIAMTLLVLSLDFDKMGTGLSSANLHELLLAQLPKFFNYARSFLLLAIFWILHHQQFNNIKQTDRGHIWINIFVLMFIALIPFSTTLVGDYPNDWMSEVFFGANMLIVGLLFSLNWYYSTKNYRLVERSLEAKRITLSKRRGLVTPAVSLLAIIVAFINPNLSSYMYILIPVILYLPILKK